MSAEETQRKARSDIDDTPTGDERREFLKKCGRFAAYAAPAIAVLLAHDGRAVAGVSPR